MPRKRNHDASQHPVPVLRLIHGPQSPSGEQIGAESDQFWTHLAEQAEVALDGVSVGHPYRDEYTSLLRAYRRAAGMDPLIAAVSR